MYGSPKYDLPDDVTLLPFDDFDVNDVIRSTAVPSLDIADKGGQVIKKDKYGRRRGKAIDHNKQESRRTAPRKTLMEKFKRAVRITNPGSFLGKGKGGGKERSSSEKEITWDGKGSDSDDDEKVRMDARGKKYDELLALQHYSFQHFCRHASPIADC